MRTMSLDKVLGRADRSALESLMRALEDMLARGGGGLLLGGLLRQMESAGLRSTVGSWLGDGANEEISSREVRRSFHHTTLAALARAAGLSTRQTADGLARLLPEVVDRLSENGHLLWGEELEARLGSLDTLQID